MSRLSIFNSDTLRLRPKALLPGIFLTAGLFLLLDSVVRTFDPFQLYGGWENPHVHSKLTFAREIFKKHGRIDAILFSTSIGLQTDVGEWEEATGGHVISYNVAMGGQRPEWARFMFENVYFPSFKPKVLIYCLAPRDVNAGGMAGTAWRRIGPLWKSVRARSILAEKPSEKAFVSLERASYLFSARRHVRRYIQQGPIAQDDISYTQQNGVNLPAVRNIRDVPRSEKERNSDSNPYRNFSMPEDGAIEELIRLAAFCKKQGIRFVLINQPVAPVAHKLFNDPEKDYQAYLDGLDLIKKSGVELLNMAAEIGLQNKHFGDDDHPNRWGGRIIANYLYQKVIKSSFPKYAKVEKLPEVLHVNFFDSTSHRNVSFFPQDRTRVGPGGVFASQLQVVTRSANARIPISVNLPPGNYLCDIYSIDERTTRTSSAPEHKVALELIGAEKTSVIPFNLSRKLVQGAGLNRLPLRIDSPSSLAVRIDKLNGSECVLDSIFIEPQITDVSSPLPTLEDFAYRPASDPFLVRNGSFEYNELNEPNFPVEWYRYTRDRQPWGSAELVAEGRNRSRAVKLARYDLKSGWGSIITQDHTGEILNKFKGRRIVVSVWAFSQSTKSYATVQAIPTMNDVKRFDAYTTPGQWQKLSASIDVAEDIDRLSISVGSLDTVPFLFDDVEITIEPPAK